MELHSNHISLVTYYYEVFLIYSGSVFLVFVFLFLFELKFSLSEIAITTPAFSSLFLLWYIVFYSSMSSLFAFFFLVCLLYDKVGFNSPILLCTLPLLCLLVPFSCLSCHLDKLTVHFRFFFLLFGSYNLFCLFY